MALVISADKSVHTKKIANWKHWSLNLFEIIYLNSADKNLVIDPH